MTEDTLIQQMRAMNYPGKVDVVDAVMAQVADRPLLAPAYARAQRWRRAAIAAAACALLAVGVNMVLLQTRQFDSGAIGGCLAEVYDYRADYGYYENAVVDDYYEAAAVDDYEIGVEELFY